MHERTRLCPLQSVLTTTYWLTLMSLNNIDLQILEVQTKRYRSSVGTRSRRSDRRPRKGGKPGQKSTFTGQRGEYVASNLEDFRNSKGAHQIVKQQFWTRYYAGYHARFNWQLPLDRDPSPDDVWKHDRELTPEETEEKSRVVALLEKVRFNVIHPLFCVGLIMAPSSNSSRPSGISTMRGYERRTIRGPRSLPPSDASRPPLPHASSPTGSFI